jgi:hypothetical protein
MLHTHLFPLFVSLSFIRLKGLIVLFLFNHVLSTAIFEYSDVMILHVQLDGCGYGIFERTVRQFASSSVRISLVHVTTDGRTRDVNSCTICIHPSRRCWNVDVSMKTVQSLDCGARVCVWYSDMRAELMVWIVIHGGVSIFVMFGNSTFRGNPFQCHCFDFWSLVETNRDKTAWLASRLLPLSCYCADHYPAIAQITVLLLRRSLSCYCADHYPAIAQITVLLLRRSLSCYCADHSQLSQALLLISQVDCLCA